MQFRIACIAIDHSIIVWRHPRFGCHAFTRGHPSTAMVRLLIVFAFCSLRGILTKIAVMTGTYDPPARGCTLRGSS
jgi:hypothetical protein